MNLEFLLEICFYTSKVVSDTLEMSLFAAFNWDETDLKIHAYK